MNEPHSNDGAQSRPAVFFDRDGVINASPGPGYVRSWDEFRFLPGVAEVLSLCRRRGRRLVLVTNQRGVFTGETPEPVLGEIHARMQERLARHDAAFDAIYAATGDRDDPRRKPSPAMLLEAARDLQLDLATSILVGDHDTDLRAGRAAGLAAVVRLRGHAAASEPADHEVRDHRELHRLLERILPFAA